MINATRWSRKRASTPWPAIRNWPVSGRPIEFAAMEMHSFDMFTLCRCVHSLTHLWTHPFSTPFSRWYIVVRCYVWIRLNALDWCFRVLIFVAVSPLRTKFSVLRWHFPTWFGACLRHILAHNILFPFDFPVCLHFICAHQSSKRTVSTHHFPSDGNATVSLILQLWTGKQGKLDEAVAAAA